MLREHRPPYQSWVTGDAAVLVDFSGSLADRLPWAFGVVAVALFVLLFLMTGSILIPIKALLINSSRSARRSGVLVWVFQDGHRRSLLGFKSTGGDRDMIPILVVAFGFGLSMDYEVFLLARIKELHDTGMANDEAVVAGLQRSGRIITSAALIVVLVFSGFVAGELLVIKETGVALAVAVAVDATLVRCLLVPATMTLLGELELVGAGAAAPVARAARDVGGARAGRGGSPVVAPRAPTPGSSRSGRTARPRSAPPPPPPTSWPPRSGRWAGRQGRGPL